MDILKVIVDTVHKAGLGVDADVRHINAYRTAIEAGVDRMHHVFTADPLSNYSVADPFVKAGVITAVASYRLTGSGAHYPDQPDKKLTGGIFA